MVVTDPIADMLTRIRNAITAKHKEVEMPMSKTKKAIAKILADEGYIASFVEVEKDVQNSLVINLKYGKEGEKVITEFIQNEGKKR